MQEELLILALKKNAVAEVLELKKIVLIWIKRRADIIAKISHGNFVI